MLDIVYVLGVIALFALVAVVAKAVEKLGPRPGGPTQPGHSRGEVRE